MGHLITHSQALNVEVLRRSQALLSVHWHKDKKNLQTLTIQFGGVKTCLFSSAFSNQGLCWNRWWKLNRQQRNCSFYSSRKFGPLFLVQTYQRCVYNKNAKAKFLVSLLALNSWTRLETLFQISDLLPLLIKNKKHSFLHSTFPRS